MANLLELPAEIRLQIYHHLFSSNDTHLLLHLELNKTYLSEIPAHRGIVTASWQCYKETIALHNASLTHLVVECERFNLWKPRDEHSSYDSTEPYQRMCHRVFDHISLYQHYRQLFRRIRKLTVPSFLSQDDILKCVRRRFSCIETLEYVSCEGPVRDLYALEPFDDSHQGRQDVTRGSNYPYLFTRTSIRKELSTRTFRPNWHLYRSCLRWNAIWDNERHDSSRLEAFSPFLDILWTTRVKWKQERPRFEDEARLVYQSPDVGPQCITIEFMYTYDCSIQKLLSLDILSVNKCAVEGCTGDHTRTAFLEYLGPKARQLLGW